MNPSQIWARASATQGVGGIALRVVGVLVAFWLIVPILIVVPLSFSGQASFDFPPDSLSIRWYENLFSDPAWRAALSNSFQIAFMVVVTSCVLGTACALGIDRSNIPGKSVLRAIVMAPMIIPLVIVAIGVYAVFLPWHLVGTKLGFVLAHTALALPFVFVSVTASLNGFDRRLETAAASLGATPLTTFFRVTLPLIMPGVFAGGVLAFITSFDEVVVALFVSDPTLRTVPVQMWDTLQDIDPTVTAASTILLGATTVLMLFAVIFNRGGDS